ncbi:small ubiquitin-related modifier 1 [Sesamum indicum]|uniref:Small ubiquitin-related modifier 1 n=1 Tax=Sesamum indicum TaxID=4182 RepID=A0A6I9U1Y4_SESIN|nr:small ubiquitin-related modifier 1 [Sesamum indicum]
MGGGDGSCRGKSAAVLPSNTAVKLCIKSQDGDELYFRFGREKRMKALLSKYCEEKNVDLETLRFLYNGRQINFSATPTELGMEDGDMIDAMTSQDGGGYFENHR